MGNQGWGFQDWGMESQGLAKVLLRLVMGCLLGLGMESWDWVTGWDYLGLGSVLESLGWVMGRLLGFVMVGQGWAMG